MLYLRPTRTFQDDLLISESPTKSHLQRPFFQTRPHSQVWGMRAWRPLSWGQAASGPQHHVRASRTGQHVEPGLHPHTLGQPGASRVIRRGMEKPRPTFRSRWLSVEAVRSFRAENSHGLQDDEPNALGRLSVHSEARVLFPVKLQPEPLRSRTRLQLLVIATKWGRAHSLWRGLEVVTRDPLGSCFLEPLSTDSGVQMSSRTAWTKRHGFLGQEKMQAGCF